MNWEFYAKLAEDNKPHLLTEEIEEAERIKSKWGFEPSETWDLDKTIAAFILPRLAYFRDNIEGIPNYCCEYDAEMHLLNEDEAIKRWEADLDKMILAFALILKDEYIVRPEEKDNQVKEGLMLFAEHFEDLWS